MATAPEPSEAPSESPAYLARILGELFSRSSSAMMLANNDRVYVDLNEAACDLLGAPRERIVGKRVEDFSAPELRDQAPAMFAEFLRVKSLSGDYTLVDVQGNEIVCSYSASANVVPGLHLSILIPLTQLEPELDLVGETQEAESVLLTEREREVLTLLALGGSNASIARELHLSPETVRSHTRSARLRLRAKSRSHAIALALQTGQLNLER